MAYGVTPAGFVRPRLPEIRREIIEDFKARLRANGLPDNIETRPDSVTGLMIDTFADREAALWEMGEGVYYAMYPGSAFGASLDRAISFSGASRGAQERSRSYVVMYGDSGTKVPEGAQIRNTATQNIWEIIEPVTISPFAASDVQIDPDVQDEADYTVSIDGAEYAHTSSESATLLSILDGLVAILTTSGHQVSHDGSRVRVLITSKLSAHFSLSENLSFSRIGSTATAQTVDRITDAANAGDLDTVVTLVDGLDAVTNIAPSSAGRAAQTDAQVRAQYPLGVFRLGAGTRPSIVAKILDGVQGVTDIRNIVNETDYVDEFGNLPHSIHVVVEGGLDAEIGQIIYKSKGAGIDTNGNVQIDLSTDEGPQEIRFSRPDYLYVWVQATVTLLPSSEEPFPINGFDLIREAIATTGAAHTLGHDVVRQRFNGPIYKSSSGIAHVELKFAVTTDLLTDPSGFEVGNISVDEHQKALFDPTRIEVA